MIQDITTKKPAECTCIDDVRNEIDNLDATIIKLFATRFEYVKEVVKYKDNTRASIEAPDRRKAVLEARRRMAEQNGLSPDVIEKIYDQLIDYFIEEEMKLINQ